jgi:hypothetical protein
MYTASIRFWPTLLISSVDQYHIYGVYALGLVGNSPNIQSYTV